MIAAGLDLGGTKIEAQVFAPDWSVLAKRRVDTPRTYAALVAAMAELIAWAKGALDIPADIPIGIGAAGLIDPATGKALTANICANGQTLPRDVAQASGCAITYINDCRALALSEAVFGAGRGHGTVMAVILGTGVGGGIAVDGALRFGPAHVGGEFGHCAAPAALVAQYDLPLVQCGCGRMGCIETYISGPGLSRLALALTGQDVSPREVAKARAGAMAQVWEAWCALVADMLRNLVLTVDPDMIVLGGGLSTIEGVAGDLSRATQAAQIGDFTVPPIVLAQGGDTSGARGAAYAAWLAR